MQPFLGLSLLCACALLPNGSALGAEKDQLSPDAELLKSTGLPADGPGLLRFFQLRAELNPKRDRVEALIQQLGIGAHSAREQAAAELVSMGVVIVPFLRQALKDPDERETASRARRCLEAIENPSIVTAAARRLAEIQPPGAAGALLAYVPFAEDGAVVEDIQSSLALLAARDDTVDPAFAAALKDSVPARRTAAALALCRAAGAHHASRTKTLLRDPKPSVRFAVGLALAALYEEDAVPVLIDLLEVLPQEQGKQAHAFLRTLAGRRAPAVAPGLDEASRKKCSKAWSAWWHSVDVEELLGFFRKRILADADRQRIQKLIRQLGDDSFEVREKATDDLIAVGTVAVPLLRQASRAADAEVVDRARDCLKRLETDRSGLDAVSAARLLAVRKPAGAAALLLRFLPFAEDEAAVKAIEQVLPALTVRDGETDPALLQALADPSPLRRAAAGEALCRAGGRERAALCKLLNDGDPSVRLRMALSLSACRERKAIPALIDLTAELPADEAWQAEEVLLRFAGEDVPAEAGSTDRRKARDRWAAWWQANGSNIDLTILTRAPRMLGYTLVVESDVNNNTGHISEYGPDGKLRWQIGGLRFPVDAHLLSGNRVLVAEQYGMRVAEYDLQGKLLRQIGVNMPVNCQRLRNGSTFVASRDLLEEVDVRNKEIFRHSRSAHDLLSAYRLADRRLVCLTTGGQCLWLDAAGKEIKSFPVGVAFLGGLEVLPNDHVLVPQYVNNKVVEVDAEGNAVWQASVTMPTSATRLENGHILVASHAMQKVVELDRGGKMIWEMKTGGRPWRARRR
jgi:HEAT repeats/PQQ-like domain